MIKNMNKGEVSVGRIKGGNLKDPVSKTDASHPASSPAAQDCSSHHSLTM